MKLEWHLPIFFNYVNYINLLIILEHLLPYFLLVRKSGYRPKCGRIQQLHSKQSNHQLWCLMSTNLLLPFHLSAKKERNRMSWQNKCKASTKQQKLSVINKHNYPLENENSSWRIKVLISIGELWAEITYNFDQFSLMK